GVLLAVDGQPDGTVARKRFWRGNFLFAIDPTLGSPGFKRFRPITRDAKGKLVRAKNADLADFSATDQYAGGVEGFYDKMDDVLSPSPLDPTTALLETVDALEEQVKTRVVSVDNGRRFLASGKPPAAMPAGAKPEAVQAELDARLARELTGRTFEYTRTDGSMWKLTLRDVFDREDALEMAYNPNDCVEQRWGAAAGSQEIATCGAHAPDAQVSKMAEYRAWFHERRRPPR